MRKERRNIFFIETSKQFLTEGTKTEILSLVIGLIAVFTFAIVQMPKWSWLVILAAMLLCSSVFRFITVDENFLKKDQKQLVPENVVNYFLSKNLFTWIFVLFILFGAFFFSAVLRKNPFNSINLETIIVSLLLVLGTDSLILVFHHQPVKGYAGGFKRDEGDDLRAGLAALKDQLPSFLGISLFAVLFFIIGYIPHILLAALYYLNGLIIAVCFVRKRKAATF